MSRKRKTNFFVILLAIIIGIVVYFVFMSEKAIAPAPETNIATQSVAATKTTVAVQTIQSQKIKANVLMFHHIGPLPANADAIRKGLTVSSGEFDKDLKYFFDNGYSFLTLDELNRDISSNNLPSKAVVLTFDDGYSDNFSEALPLLKKYNAVGTFFIITGKIGQNEYMTKDQVVDLSTSGNEIGSHTINHLDLATLKGAALTKEITQSKTDLEALVQKPVSSFCYPSGKYNDETVKAVQAAGYKMAVTTHPSTGIISLDSLLTIARYRISESMNLEALIR